MAEEYADFGGDTAPSSSSWWNAITDWFSPSQPTNTVDYSKYDWSSPSVLETAFGDKYTNYDPTQETTSVTMPDGSIAYNNGVVIKPNGDVMLNGEKVSNTQTVDGSTPDTSWVGTLGTIGKAIGTGATGVLKNLITDTKGNIDPAKLAGIAGGILGGVNPSWANTQQKSVGYQGGIPSYTATREQVPGTYDPNRRPGSRGQEYFTQTQFTAPSNAPAAQETAKTEAAAAAERNKARTSAYAAGGIANLAKGRYLAGATDGMADKIPATIGSQQPAKLSHGEFVIPADVVSHLGNGNSEAGADRLYGMMDKVRKARTGTTKQGKQINPNKYMPG